MTTDIHTAIVDALALKLDESPSNIEGDYGTHITTVAEALLEREYVITEELKAVALRETEFSAGQLDELFTQVGLSVRPQPEPEPVVEEPVTVAQPGSLEDRVGNLESGLGKVAEALNTLTRLAERHLGTSSL